MSAPDYPLMALGSYETYQLAHIATFVAERLARHRSSGRGRAGRAARLTAIRDLTGAMTALDNASGVSTAGQEMPRPLDRETFAAASELLTTGPRTAEVVSLRGAGRDGWAVLGHIPGVGAVGAQAPTQEIADAVRTHFLTRPAAELSAWAVTEQPTSTPTLPTRIDLAAFVEQLDPNRPDDRAVARHLRGQDRRTDAAIRGRFADVDLDAAPVVTPSPSRGTQSGGPESRTPRRAKRRRTAGAARGGAAPAPGAASPARTRGE